MSFQFRQKNCALKKFIVINTAWELKKKKKKIKVLTEHTF